MPQYTDQDTTAYSCTRTFHRHEGTMAIPVAGTVDGLEEASIVQLHSPFEYMTVTWIATAEGKPPTIPDPLTFSTVPNVAFHSRQISAPISIPIGTGKGYNWQVSGVYTYTLKKPRDIKANIPTGRIPFETDNTADSFTIPATYFDANMLSKDTMAGGSSSHNP